MQTIIAQSIPSDLPTSVQEGWPGTDFEVYLGYPPRGCAGEPFVGSTDDVVTVTPETRRSSPRSGDTDLYLRELRYAGTVTARGVPGYYGRQRARNAELTIAAEDNHRRRIRFRFSMTSFGAHYGDIHGLGWRNERTRRPTWRGVHRVVVTAHTDAGRSVCVLKSIATWITSRWGRRWRTRRACRRQSIPWTLMARTSDSSWRILSGIRFARTSEDLSSTLANTIVATRSIPLGRDPVEFWPTYTGSGFGLISQW